MEATHDFVCAYKPNAAFYEAHGAEGIAALWRTIADIHVIAPDVPVILDAKRADIGNTNAGYVEAAFEYLRVDAITVHPYLGAEALQPFLERKDKESSSFVVRAIRARVNSRIWMCLATWCQATICRSISTLHTG